MKHHKNKRGYKKLKLLHSPLTPPIYLPPLATSTKKEANPAEVERKDPVAR
jgi:hypothetical protein